MNNKYIEQLVKTAQEQEKYPPSSIVSRSLVAGGLGAGVGGVAGYLKERNDINNMESTIRDGIAKAVSEKEAASLKLKEMASRPSVVLPGGAALGPIVGPETDAYIKAKKDIKARQAVLDSLLKDAASLKRMAALKGAGVVGGVAALAAAGGLAYRNKQIEDQQFIKPWVNV